MDKISLGLMALLMVAMAVVIAPGVIALNRGRALRNIAIWLAIVVALALVYRTFGPGGHGLIAPPAVTSGPGQLAPAAVKNTGVHGYSPPGD